MVLYDGGKIDENGGEGVPLWFWNVNEKKKSWIDKS